MFRRLLSLLTCSLIFAAILIPNAAVADITTKFGDKFPVPNGVYELVDGTTYQSIDIELIAMSLRSTGPGHDLPPAGQTFQVDSFFDIFVEIRVGGSTGETFQVDSFFDVFFEVTADAAGSKSFETEMLSMDLRGTGPNGPDTLIMRLDSARPSQGLHLVTDLGNGTFNVDSFFDIFTEISIDGGSNFFQATDSAPVSLNSVIPEPASFVVLTPILGLLVLRRRRSGTKK